LKIFNFFSKLFRIGINCKRLNEKNDLIKFGMKSNEWGEKKLLNIENFNDIELKNVKYFNTRKNCNRLEHCFFDSS